MGKQKKLLLLGGLRYLLPVIESAHRLGYYVITCDYLPNNIAHKYSDEYVDASIIDKDVILRVAQEKDIDGIMSFAVDPGVVTASYVAEKMGLPFQGSYRSVSILQDKSEFRKFLTENGFNVPVAKGYDDKNEALGDTARFNWPIIVKPVDSAGSKGVSRVDKLADLPAAIDYALSESHSNKFIIEDFLEQEGFSSDSECFTVDGELVYCSFNDQRFDRNAENPYTPAGFSWPTTMPQWAQDELQGELQRLMRLLDMKTGIYNVETRLCKNGKPYIMEVSPRGGGNRLAEMLNYSTHTNLVDCSVLAAMGELKTAPASPQYYGHLAEVVLHADHSGIFDGVEIAKEKQSNVIETDFWVKEGDAVQGFDGANRSLGSLVLRFGTLAELETAMGDIKSWCQVKVK